MPSRGRTSSSSSTSAAAANVRTIPADAFASVLRRFAFRFLSASGEQQRLALLLSVPLATYLCDPGVMQWPWTQLAETPAAAAQLLDDLMPDELLLEHVGAAFELLTDLVAST